MSSPRLAAEREGQPASNSSCIWMTAGIIAYKLCDRGFQCDGCPFDAVLRGAQIPPPAVTELPARTAFPADRVYHPAHTWAQARDSRRIRIGLDALAARLADRMTGVVLPIRGQRLERDKTGVWLLDEAGTLAVCMPVTGIVRETNLELHQRPWLAVEEQYGAGWLLELETPEAGALTGLLSAAAMTRRAIADLASLRQRAAELAGSHRMAADPTAGELKIGATSFDGGEIHPELRAILGAAAYHALVQPLLAAPGSGSRASKSIR